jgi:hypothetical protein
VASNTRNGSIIEGIKMSSDSAPRGSGTSGWYWVTVGGLVVISVWFLQAAVGYIWAADVSFPTDANTRAALMTRAAWDIGIAVASGTGAIVLIGRRLIRFLRTPKV